SSTSPATRTRRCSTRPRAAAAATEPDRADTVAGRPTPRPDAASEELRVSTTLQQRSLPVQQPTRSSPFGGAAPGLRTAVTYLVAAAVWVTIGDLLPGGR